MIGMVGFDKYLLVIFRISKEGLTGGSVWHFSPVNKAERNELHQTSTSDYQK
jgi:hypothetical protein